MSTPESAVQRCLDAYNQADAREDARNDFSPEALARVNRAWRRAMPILTPDTIDAFIACVTHGLLYQVFPLAEASKLLYAAQVTLGLLRARHEAARQQPKSQPAGNPTPSPVEGGEAAVSRTAGAPPTRAIHPSHNPPVPHPWRQLHRHHGWETTNPNPGNRKHPPPSPSTKAMHPSHRPSRAPSMATASSSPWVGDHEPQPSEPGDATPTPLPPSQMAPKAQLAAPQVPRKQAIKDREQVEAFLAQAFATPPPTPSPFGQSAAPQVPATQVPQAAAR